MNGDTGDRPIEGIGFFQQRSGGEAPFVGRPPAEARVRMTLGRAGVALVRLIGPPGVGKTELIRATLARLSDPLRVAVIAVNPAAGRDIDRLRAHCGHAVGIEAPVPTPSSLWRIISELPLTELDLILVEGSSGMRELPDLGQDATVAVLAETGGDDKAAEYHPLLASASVVLLNKCDIRPGIGFNERIFRRDIRAANSDADIFDVSATTGAGMERWHAWLEAVRDGKRKVGMHAENSEMAGERYIS